MADEITLVTNLRAAKTSAGVDILRNVSKRVTMTGDAFNCTMQTIGFAAHEAISIGDVATVGVCLFINSDATNFVDIGRDSGGTFVPAVRLKPGEPAMFRAANNALYAKADTANVKLQCWILED